MSQALPANALSRVTVVTVSYRSAPLLPDMLASIPKGVAVVVVDNGSGDATPAIAAARGARLVALPVNQGFGRGCNAGAALAATEFLFFVNPDAMLLPGAIERLVGAADALPAASAFNPAILRHSGKVHFRRRSLLVPRTEWLSGAAPRSVTELPALLGSALFCRRDCFIKVGGFDPAIFLYHEDDDLSVRMRKDCGPAYIVPEAQVRHQSGHSSGRDTATAWHKGYHMARSRIYALAKFGRPLPRIRTIGRAVAELALPHNLFSARRRAKQFGLIAGAVSAWRDGGAYSPTRP